MAATCPLCDRVHVRGDVIAVGKFDAAGAYAYRTADGALHATREDGQEHLCWQRRQRPTPPEQTGSAT
jgi:hypothetical protein